LLPRFQPSCCSLIAEINNDIRVGLPSRASLRCIMTQTAPIQPVERQPWVVHLRHAGRVTPEQFWKVCQDNPDWRVELAAGGDIVIMPPTGGETGARSLKLAQQLGVWAEKNGSGVAFDSSTGFVLPNGAIRSPDASWIVRERLARLSRARKRTFLPLCPDFVVELRSPADRLTALQSKMREYVSNGARLGWLIDPQTRTAYVYRPRGGVVRLRRPARLSGDPVLGGFVLDLTTIWNPGL
jgi:Uma2 family endonuclease